MQKSAPIPDDSWSLDRLGQYVRKLLGESEAAEKEAVLQRTKSATALFAAGSALYLVRKKLKGNQHGAWKAWRERHELSATTVNDAIRLFEAAKTPDALTGLGVTEAKQKYVYGKSAKPKKSTVWNGKTTPLKPAIDHVATLESLVQRLSEFQQNELGQVHFKEEDISRWQHAVLIAGDILTKIAERMAHDVKSTT